MLDPEPWEHLITGNGHGDRHADHESRVKPSIATESHASAAHIVDHQPRRLVLAIPGSPFLSRV